VLSALSLVPRVFSPQGGFAARDVAIGFTLGRAGPATIRVYNRAGRLVRTVIGGLPLEAGANLVRWDGRDEDAAIVPDGIYLVAVEALGETQRRTLAVVR
jgi:flagellar hook assembly protein FlgD